MTGERPKWSMGIPKDDTWGRDLIRQFEGNLEGLAIWGLSNRKSVVLQFVCASTLLDIKELLKDLKNSYLENRD